MAGNIADTMELLAQAICKDHEVPHAILTHPYEYATGVTDPLLLDQNNVFQKLGMGIMGRYWAIYPNLADGQMSFLSFTQDGKLRTDANVNIGALTVTVSPTVWTKRYYREVTTISNVNTNVAFGFIADEITVANDDNTNSVWINYGGAAVADATHDKILSSEQFVDKFRSPSIDIITNVVGPVVVRVWARAL